MLVNTDSLYLQLSAVLGTGFSYDNDLRQHQGYRVLIIFGRSGYIHAVQDTRGRKYPPPPKKRKNWPHLLVTQISYLKTRKLDSSQCLCDQPKCLNICKYVGVGYKVHSSRKLTHILATVMPNNILVKNFHGIKKKKISQRNFWCKQNRHKCLLLNPQGQLAQL